MRADIASNAPIGFTAMLNAFLPGYGIAAHTENWQITSYYTQTVKVSNPAGGVIPSGRFSTYPERGGNNENEEKRIQLVPRCILIIPPFLAHVSADGPGRILVLRHRAV